MRRILISLTALMVLSVVISSWSAVYLLHRASEARADQASQAEAYVQTIRDDVAEVLQEVRDPSTDTRRNELWRRTERIEEKVDLLVDQLIPTERSQP